MNNITTPNDNLRSTLQGIIAAKLYLRASSRAEKLSSDTTPRAPELPERIKNILVPLFMLLHPLSPVKANTTANTEMVQYRQLLKLSAAVAIPYILNRFEFLEKGLSHYLEKPIMVSCGSDRYHNLTLEKLIEEYPKAYDEYTTFLSLLVNFLKDNIRKDGTKSIDDAAFASSIEIGYEIKEDSAPRVIKSFDIHVHYIMEEKTHEAVLDLLGIIRANLRKGKNPLPRAASSNYPHREDDESTALEEFILKNQKLISSFEPRGSYKKDQGQSDLVFIMHQLCYISKSSIKQGDINYKKGHTIYTLKEGSKIAQGDATTITGENIIQLIKLQTNKKYTFNDDWTPNRTEENTPDAYDRKCIKSFEVIHGEVKALFAENPSYFEESLDKWAKDNPVVIEEPNGSPETCENPDTDDQDAINATYVTASTEYFPFLPNIPTTTIIDNSRNQMGSTPIAVLRKQTGFHNIIMKEARNKANRFHYLN